MSRRLSESLTEAQREKIRKLKRDGLTLKDLASRFGVSKGQIENILRTKPDEQNSTGR